MISQRIAPKIISASGVRHASRIPFKLKNDDEVEQNAQPFDEQYKALAKRLYLYKKASKRPIFLGAKRLWRFKSDISDLSEEEKSEIVAQPGSKDLTRILDSVKEVDHLKRVQDIVKDYARFVPDNIKNSHLIHYLRTGLAVSDYNSPVSAVLTGHEFKPVRDKDVLKEIARVYAIRATKPYSGTKLKHSLFSIWKKMPVRTIKGTGKKQRDINSYFIMMYGLQQLVENSGPELYKKNLQREIGTLLKELKLGLEHTEIPENPPSEGLPNTVIDFTFGQTVLKKLGEDTSKVDEIMKVVSSPLKNPAGLFENYKTFVLDSFAETDTAYRERKRKNAAKRAAEKAEEMKLKEETEESGTNEQIKQEVKEDELPEEPAQTSS